MKSPKGSFSNSPEKARPPSGSTQILAAQLLLNFLGFVFHARGAGGA